jgi:hypothetical protein
MRFNESGMMLIKIGTALAFIALSAPAFAQTLGGFQDVQGYDRRGRYIPPPYRTTPSNSNPNAPAKPAANPYTGQIGAPPPPPAFSGTYNNTYSGTYGNTYGR